MSLSIIKQVIKRIFLYYRKLRLSYEQKVRFLPGSVICKHTILEGHNSIGENSRLTNVEMGVGSYTGSNTYLCKVKVGRFCSIASNVRNLIGSHPTTTFVSTHPSFFSPGRAASFTFVNEQKFNEVSYTDNSNRWVAEIGNDVWIGENVLIKDGVKIGDGAVIGANSFVTRDIEPFSICYGTPAKVKKYRFDRNSIEFFLSYRWWDKELSWIKQNVNNFSDYRIFKKNLKK